MEYEIEVVAFQAFAMLADPLEVAFYGDPVTIAPSTTRLIESLKSF